MSGGENMGKKVLIIEDNPDYADLVGGQLKKEGFEVETAKTGMEGLRKAPIYKPDLITLDLGLPDMSGFEVCAQMKKIVALGKCIIIVLSAKDDTGDITNAFHAGADDYVIKPPEPEYLVRKIKLYLGAR
jgi:two-component system alkaline phosphatase synthesis response regulator PhoP